MSVSFLCLCRLRVLPLEYLSLSAQALRVRLVSMDPLRYHGPNMGGMLLDCLFCTAPLTAIFKVQYLTNTLPSL